jgi:hypothetical protein
VFPNNAYTIGHAVVSEFMVIMVLKSYTVTSKVAVLTGGILNSYGLVKVPVMVTALHLVSAVNIVEYLNVPSFIIIAIAKDTDATTVSTLCITPLVPPLMYKLAASV